MKLRPELVLAKLWKLSTRAASVRAYYAAHPVVKLNIGSGQTAKPGWLNTDVYPRYDGVIFMDAAKPFPLPDASVDFVYTEHMIEHIPLRSALDMLREVHRVLRPGGRVRIATPAMTNIVGIAGGNLTPVQLTWVRSLNTTWGKDFEDASPDNPCYAINRVFRGFSHQFIYDRDTIAEVLSHAGFCDIAFCEVGRSTSPEFQDVETHAGENYAFETMIAEARKAQTA